jgi:hypothetical protein
VRSSTTRRVLRTHRIKIPKIGRCQRLAHRKREDGDGAVMVSGGSGEGTTTPTSREDVPRHCGPP